MVLLVRLQMLSQLTNSSRQNGNLEIGTARIFFVLLERSGINLCIAHRFCALQVSGIANLPFVRGRRRNQIPPKSAIRFLQNPPLRHFSPTLRPTQTHF